MAQENVVGGRGSKGMGGGDPSLFLPPLLLKEKEDSPPSLIITLVICGCCLPSLLPSFHVDGGHILTRSFGIKNVSNL